MDLLQSQWMQSQQTQQDDVLNIPGSDFGSKKHEGVRSYFAWYAIFMVVDEDGDLLFSEADAEWLSQLDWAYTEPLYVKMVKHARFVVDLEQLKKNSESEMTGTFTSGSPST